MVIKIKIKKIVLIIISSISIVILYTYSKPKYYVKNTEAKNLPHKIMPFGDSIHVYIPYKLTIYNNRLSTLEVSGIYDGKSNIRGGYLFYNNDNLELSSYWNASKKLKTENNYQEYGENAYWRIEHIIEYRNTIFPFLTRDFFYYKRYTLSNENNRLNINKIAKDSIFKQIFTLHYNISTDINESIIDSLYKGNNDKRFNVIFSSESLIMKKIRARINSEKQETIYVNFNDSIKGMDKEEKRKYLLKQMKRQPKDMF